MNTEFIEEINPLDEAVNEKRYAQPNINTTGIDLNQPIEEPKFTPPPIPEPKKTGSSGSGSKEKPEPINPEMKNLSKKDTQLAAEKATDIIIAGYEMLHVLANRSLRVSEKKLNQLQQDGEINLNAMIDYDYGKKIRAGDFFEEYNNQVSNLLTVSDEFKAEFKPALSKVLAKKGIGVSDETEVGFILFKDISAKAVMFMQQKAQLKSMIDHMKEATMLQREQMYAQQAQAQQQQAQAQREAEMFARQQQEQTQYAEEQEEQREQKPVRERIEKARRFRKQQESETIATEPEEYAVDVTKKEKGRGRPKKYE